MVQSLLGFWENKIGLEAPREHLKYKVLGVVAMVTAWVEAQPGFVSPYLVVLDL